MTKIVMHLVMLVSVLMPMCAHGGVSLASPSAADCAVINQAHHKTLTLRDNHLAFMRSHMPPRDRTSPEGTQRRIAIAHNLYQTHHAIAQVWKDVASRVHDSSLKNSFQRLAVPIEKFAELNHSIITTSHGSLVFVPHYEEIYTPTKSQQYNKAAADSVYKLLILSASSCRG